jgi:hypothetical protein
MHGSDRAPLDRSANETRQWECGKALGGARIASDSIKILVLNYFLCVNLVCKNLMPLFGSRRKGIPMPSKELSEHQTKYIH